MSPDDFSEKIELLINDENRVVTYKILSYELKIHVNKAKQCMMDFLNAQKTKGIVLEAHYFLSGFIEKDGIHMLKVVVVSEDKLEKAKKSFSELSSFHIYSIHKGTIQDECALYSTDFTYIKDKEGQSKYSAIKHPDIQIQPPVLNKVNLNSDTSASLTKTLGSKVSAPKIVPVNSKAESAKKVIENGISPEKNKEVKDSPNKDAKSSPDTKKQKSGTLMSMWQKKDEKPNGIKKDNSKPDSKGKETAKAAPKNNILSMFSKQAVKNAEKPPMPKSSVTKVVEEPSKPAIPEVTEKEDTLKTAKTNETKRSSQKRKIPNKQTKRSSKSKNDSDDSDSEFRKPKVKKHRRICTFEDSSESENEEEKEKQQRSFFLPEEPMDTAVATPVSEDEEPIPPTPPVIHVKGKAKVWKAVQKTYEDEEGFFVTKSEKELVSASEDEEDPIKNKPPVKKEEVFNKKSSSVNKKQASLMSFFKQK